MLLAEGIFSKMEEIQLNSISLPDNSPKDILEAWELPLFSQSKDTKLHFNLPENKDPESMRIYCCRKDGTWEKSETAVNGRYLVFTARSGDQAFCLEQVPDYSKVVSAIGVILGFLLLSVLWILIRKYKCRHSVAQKQEK